eukprot:gene25397-biopygen10591
MSRGGCSRPESNADASSDSQGNLNTQKYRELYGAYSKRLISHSGESSLAPHEVETHSRREDHADDDSTSHSPNQVRFPPPALP